MTDKELAKKLFAAVGPAERIAHAYNCMTRLRLHVKDGGIPAEEIKKIPGVLGVNKSGDEWQIVLGPGKATKVTKEFKALLEQEGAMPQSDSSTISSLAQAASVGDGKELHDAIRKKNATPAKLALKKISAIFVPIIPAFIACGLITGLLNVALKIEPSWAASPIAQMLAVAGSAAFFGLNIFVGINAVKVFGGSPMIGGVLAAVMSHPSLASISADGIAFAPGRGGVVAVLLVSLFAAWLEKKLHRHIPDMFDLFATPLITVLLSTFAALCICQPVGGCISEAIGAAATESIRSGGAVTGFLLGGAFLPMVMAGVHQGLTPIHAELLARYGVTILLPVLAMAGGGQVGAALAVYVKTKNKGLRKTIATALPVGIMGVGEPLIYGVTLPLGKPFIGACIGGACGGAVQAYYMVGSAALGISGLPLAASTDNIPIYLLGLAVSYAVGFIAAWILGFDDPEP